MGENNRVELSVRDFAQPGVDVAADGHNLQIRPDGQQLRSPTR
ncbi:unannotated protein [freshwater metagenome]|uniref:Unannotated protein n=1 Tax=freshwater metagenome TaxID=449393 RepID=A0A6J7BW06_9ZZZZ